MDVLKEQRGVVVGMPFRRRRFRRSRDILIVLWTVLFTYYYNNGAVQGSALRGEESGHNPAAGDLLNTFSPVKISSQEGEGEEYGLENDYPEGWTPGPAGADDRNVLNKGRNKYGQWEVPGVNCTPPGIDDFPPDIFTPAQRQQGFVIVHFLVSLYIFVGLAVVCDDYFVPSMERICEDMNLPSDVAGATFMAIATSAPELFTNIIGTFITKGDIGIGTIVGSAVFNILAVAAVCGIGAGMVVPLEWWSVTRDCLCYSVTVVLLLIVLQDERIYWYEALTLVLVYLIYILVMFKNSTLKRRAEKLVLKAEKRLKRGNTIETTYSTKADAVVAINGGKVDEVEEAKEDEEGEENQEMKGLCEPPSEGGCRDWAEWILCWPCRLVFTFTVPDCRSERWKKWYPLTFAMCIIWIGTLSYVVNWMMTIIGHTLKIPDSVMGLTFIAAGTSVPEVVSSLIVARQGLGTMAVSNSIGSNTFDVLMCLGIPWLIRSLMLVNDEVEDYIQINSTGLEYSTMMLILSVAVLYVILALNKFKLDKKVGYLSLLLYAVFLVMASLFELNVFFTVNLPTCQYWED